MIAFECVCGRLPYQGRSVGDVFVLICSEPLPVPSTLRPLPPAFDAWFAKAATRDPEGRFQSAKEMADALRAIAGEEHYTPDPSASGENRRAVEEARPLDADSMKDLERARTVSVGGTMGGASSAITRPSGRSSRLIAAAVAAVGVLGASAWFVSGRHSGASVNAASAQSGLASVDPPKELPPITPPSAAPISSASAAAAPTASASASSQASASKPRVRPPTHAASATTGDTKNDELTF